MPIRQSYLVRAQKATGVSESQRWAMPSGTVTVECSFTLDPGTACTSLAVDLEGSVSSNFYFALASHKFTSAELTNGAAMWHVIDKPIKLVRSNVRILEKTGSGDVSVSVVILSTDV